MRVSVSLSLAEITFFSPIIFQLLQILQNIFYACHHFEFMVVSRLTSIVSVLKITFKFNFYSWIHLFIYSEIYFRVISFLAILCIVLYTLRKFILKSVSIDVIILPKESVTQNM